MAAMAFLLKGVGFAIGAAVFGLVVVSLLELAIAKHDPERWRIIRARPFLENVRHMLN